MSTQQTILALDFDGVVWDSVGESYYVARMTWEQLFGPLPRDIGAEFRIGRWLVRTGHDFYALISIILGEPDADLRTYSKQRFKDFLTAHQPEADRFDRLFYQTRDRERDERPDHWLSLQPPFANLVSSWPELCARFRDVVITTTKDQASVHFLLGRAGVQTQVLGKEFSRFKDAQVQHLAASHGIPTRQVLLLDDLIDNLLPVREAGARVALASWGYNTPAEQDEAASMGMPVIRYDHIVEDLSRAAAA